MSLVESTRCPDCGSLYSLVGRMHYCRQDPRIVDVTKVPGSVTKVGRPSLKGVPMTAAERKRRQRNDGR